MSQDEERPSEDPATAFEAAGQDKPPSLAKEFWLFIMENKAWWMIPILVTLGLLGLLVAFGQTGAAPFIYTLF